MLVVSCAVAVWIVRKPRFCFAWPEKYTALSVNAMKEVSVWSPAWASIKIYIYRCWVTVLHCSAFMQKDVRVGTRGKHSCNFQNKFFAHTGTTFTDLQPLKPANTHQEKKKPNIFIWDFYAWESHHCYFGLFLVQKYSQESSQIFQPLSVSLC